MAHTHLCKVSVVVPVYNAEAYLEECIDSILGQTLTDIEVIAVDDGSTDGSAAILKKYAERDKRLKVVMQENAGVSTARNNGIREAKGEYVSFIDSDDWIDADFLEKLYNAAKENNADIAAASVMLFGGGKRTRRLLEYKRNQVLNTLREKYVCFRVFKYNYTCNKIYRRDALVESSIIFEPERYFEDMLFMPLVTEALGRGVAVSGTAYHYRRNPMSITHTVKANLKVKSDLRKARAFRDKFALTHDLPMEFMPFERVYVRFLGIPIIKIAIAKTRKRVYIFGIRLFELERRKIF